MTEGRGSGELEGSTLGSSSRDGDRARRSQRRTPSSSSFLVDSSFLPKSSNILTSSHRPRRSDSHRNEKRGAPEGDIATPKKRSRFPWSRNRESLEGSSVIAGPHEAAETEAPGPSSAQQPPTSEPPPARTDNTEAAPGLDRDSLQIVNLALNLRAGAPITYTDSTTLTTSTGRGYQALHTHRDYTQAGISDRATPPPGESSVLDLLPNAAAGEPAPQAFSESTLARAERARRHFELFHLYLRLLPSLPPLRHHGTQNPTDASSVSRGSLPQSRDYNPLQAIRNRKVRFRERRPIDPESEGWYDVARVREWVNSVQSQYGDKSHLPSECLKLPPFERGQKDPPREEPDDPDMFAASPPSSLRRVSRTSSIKARRPRFDWTISPAELLADAAWVEEDLNKSKIVDGDGNLLFLDPAELRPSGDMPPPSAAQTPLPAKPPSADARHAASDTSFSNAHPALGPEFRSVNRGRRRHRYHSPAHGFHSRGTSATGIGAKERKLRLRSSSSSSVSSTGERPAWYHHADNIGQSARSRLTRARNSQLKSSITAPDEEHGLDTGPLPSQTSAGTQPTWAKLDERSGSLSSAASRPDPSTTATPPVPLGYFPSIASSLSPPSSRSPSPSKRQLAQGIIARHARNKSRSRPMEILEDKLISAPSTADSLQQDISDTAHRAGKLEPSPIPDHVSPFYQADKTRSQTHARKGSFQPESRLRGILKGPGKIAEIVGYEVSKMGELIMKKDDPSHSRTSSLETTLPSEDSALDEGEEAKGEKRSRPKALLRRLPTFSDATPRKHGERGSAKNLLQSAAALASPSRRTEQEEQRRASAVDGPDAPLHDAQVSQTKRLAASMLQKKQDAQFLTEKIGDGRRFEPEFHAVRHQIKKGQIKDPSVPFSMNRPPVTGLAQAEVSAADGPQDKRRGASCQSRTWSISNRSISTSVDSGIPERREIERTRALLLTSGIKAREITRRAESIRSPPADFLQKAYPDGPVPQVIRLYEFDVAATGLLRRFEASHDRFRRSVEGFPKASAALKTQLAQLEDMVNQTLAPRVRALADDAENLSVELNTTSTLAVKQLSDKLDKGMRKRHRRLRWLRRTGFVMLEWALVGMLWWVWLIVMAFKVLRYVFRGAISGIRWVLCQLSNYGGDDLSQSRLAAKNLVLDVLKKRAAEVDVDRCGPGEEDAFYVADMGEIYRQHLRWKMNLGRVKPFYAVKCNPDPEILRLMAKLGNGFDCASKAEIDLALETGIDPSRIIYAQPCKTKSYLRYAAKVGVKQMTFDNADELYKIKACYPDAELYLRILTDDSTSLCRLSMKFGASLDIARQLLELAHELELKVVGVSFHVGSGAEDPRAFLKAVQDARLVFDQAAEVGHELHTLDVGGGFCQDTFEKFAGILSEALDTYFPPHIRIIAEPGRYYVASAFTLAANVIARRDVRDPEEPANDAYMLYLNDGVYGNFSNIIFDHQHPVAKILTCSQTQPALNAATSEGIAYSIWGPTCDGIDVITQRIVLPGLLDVGDWLYFEEMGAYTKCSATRFNGFSDNHEVIYISSEAGATALLEY
ncbi:hypothetical protein CNMCM5793_008887 [Aspergillus hiratsukae]|uniref:Ornithine decarboxylase n=1 Tax=Aspergillus hiratsukae TaxID=1194566 RepID=A0A8H6P7R9_9EURO|nr:hypothetical protein CNMCM5793_008887 [Aspergillus hiratsukae]KAF7160772.1 hypothetical protein CNMCM6106_008178 [Aspergillus hiratsukae]